MKDAGGGLKFGLTAAVLIFACTVFGLRAANAQERRKIRISNATLSCSALPPVAALVSGDLDYRSGIGNIIRAIKVEGRFTERNVGFEAVAEPRFAIEVAKELGYQVQ